MQNLQLIFTPAVALFTDFYQMEKENRFDRVILFIMGIRSIKSEYLSRVEAK